jgi:hypothetical protein
LGGKQTKARLPIILGVEPRIRIMNDRLTQTAHSSYTRNNEGLSLAVRRALHLLQIIGQGIFGIGGELLFEHINEAHGFVKLSCPLVWFVGNGGM